MFKRTIRQSPGIYINEDGVLSKIEDILKELKIHTPLVITDTTVKKVSTPFLPPNFYDQHPFANFAGANTYPEAQRLSAIAKKIKADGIIALGGGQLMDSAKLVANAIDGKLINIQTVPSNCAAFTTKSIVYNDQHEMIDNYRVANPVTAVLLEPQILQEAPTEYINSGIGDTLAKYYEIRRRLPKGQLTLASEAAARYFIDHCRTEMLKVTNVSQLKGDQLTNFIDTIFLFAATVDGLADLNGRSVAAHTFYNAYVKVKRPSKYPHGVVVALGNLIQVLLEGNQKLATEIRQYYPKVGLPLTLDDLDVDPEEEKQIAKAMTAKDNVRMQTIFPNVTVDQIEKVFKQLR